MEQYISKATVVTEIEKRKKEWQYGSSIEAKYKKEECDDILSFLDTLEVKDMDLNEDVDRILEEHDWNYDKIDFYEFAKHFFELGLKVQKGE